MADFSAAISSLQEGQKTYNGFKDAEAAIAVLQGYAQNEKELTDAVAVKKSELADLQSKVDVATNTVEAANEEAEGILVKARQDAQVIVSTAENEAADIREQQEADTKAATDAIVKANNDLAKLNAEIDNLMAARDKLSAEVTKQKQALTGALSTLG